VFLLFGIIVVLSHLSRINGARDNLLQTELPRLAAVTEDQLLSYFDLNVRSLRLLADAYDWEETLTRFAEDPEYARRMADSYADALQVASVDFVDFERRLVHAYWSSEPIRLDPERERDAWFFETWDVAEPPETQVTLYYDEDMGGNAVYTDHLLRTGEGAPLGLVGILSDVATLAGHIQRTLIEDEFFFLLNASGDPMVRVEHDDFKEFGPVYNLEGRSEAASSDTSARLLRALETSASDATGFVSRPMAIPGLGAEGVVFLNVRSRLQGIRVNVFTQMVMLLIAYAVLVGSYIALMSIHSRNMRARAAIIHEHRTRLDDVISVLTHNLSNDLQALRQRLSAPAFELQRVAAGNGDPRGEWNADLPERSSDAILMDMEQVVQNAVYSSQLGSSSVTSAVHHTVPTTVLERLRRACGSVAAAKRQDLRIMPRSTTPLATDEDLLFHLLFNLLGNATKFSPPGATIICAAEDAAEGGEDSVVFTVIDQGPGFSRDDRTQLFEKHRRLSARPTGGERSTGMGLYVTKRLAATIGATLSLQDEPPRSLGFLYEELDEDGEGVGEEGEAAKDELAFSEVGAVWRVHVPVSPRSTADARSNPDARSDPDGRSNA
jgi:signal transduction histidine kinase